MFRYSWRRPDSDFAMSGHSGLPTQQLLPVAMPDTVPLERSTREPGGTDSVRSPAERSLVESAHDRVLLVVSESYARAMEDDLVALGERGGDLLMVGGAYDIDGIGSPPGRRDSSPGTGWDRVKS